MGQRRPAVFPVLGVITKAKFERINLNMHASLVAGMKMEVVGMVAEGDLVAIGRDNVGRLGNPALDCFKLPTGRSMIWACKP